MKPKERMKLIAGAILTMVLEAMKNGASFSNALTETLRGIDRAIIEIATEFITQGYEE